MDDEAKLDLEVVREQRAELEAAIDANLHTLLKPVQSLAEAICKIRDERLYLPDYKSFRDYCYRRWGKSTMWASYLVGTLTHVEDTRHTKTLGRRPVAQVESGTDLEPSQPEALAPVAQAGQAAVRVQTPPVELLDAEEEDDDRLLVAEQESDPERFPPIDKFGRAIPEEIRVPFWTTAEAVQSILVDVRRFRRGFRAAMASQVPEGTKSYAELSGIDKILADLEAKVKSAAPVGVCPHCGGGGCQRCSNDGWFSQKESNRIDSTYLKGTR